MSKNILIIGSGPIKIGQACEFDYAGVQAVNTIKKLGYKAIIINNNPATVMTDKTKHTSIYLETISTATILKIIKKEKVSLILPNVGGQTALNAVSTLKKLELNKVKILGASIQAIKNAEDRNKFRKLMKKIKIKIPQAYTAKNIKSALKIRKKLIKATRKQTVVIRTSYTLGGSGGGITKNKQKFTQLVNKALKNSPQHKVLIEESLIGNKEYELEVLVDKMHNFITVCVIENIDKTGVHTGDSISITPPQTITNYEFQKMRNMTKKIMKTLKIKNSGANIQYSINPQTGKITVIEVNPRVSRSSALASKATGYPIAKISTLLSLGIPFYKIKKKIAGRLPAFYEPAIDYFAIKIPQFCNTKFNYYGCKLDTEMKSTGEALAISNNCKHALQLALSATKTNNIGFEITSKDLTEIKHNTRHANELRLNSSFELSKFGIKNKTDIDYYFKNIINKIAIEDNKASKSTTINPHLKKLKQIGYTDEALIKKFKIKYTTLTKLKDTYKIKPRFKVIDTCAKEFKTNSSYIYSTYTGKHEIKPLKTKNILIIGSGPNKIGQGIEFDYCGVHAAVAIKKLGYKAIIINNNPATVSTDYDVANRLYLLATSVENILAIYAFEQNYKIIIQFCGQLAVSTLKKLELNKVKILGASIQAIKNAEDRNKFRKLMKKIKIKIPQNIVITKPPINPHPIKQLLPVIIRPSYVLGGENMKIIKTNTHLQQLLKQFTSKRYKYTLPIIIDKFINKAQEYDIDCIATNNNIKILAILKQIDTLGTHSGDSSAYLLKHNNLYIKIHKTCKKIIKALKIKGFCNIQLAIKHNTIIPIEVNARASRTIPFINKATNTNHIKLYIKALLQNKQIKIPQFNSKLKALKTAVFSTYKFKNTNNSLGPEMKSTGEAITFANTIPTAFAKSQQNYLKRGRRLLLIITMLSNEIREIIQEIHNTTSNVKIYCNKNITLPKVKHLASSIHHNYNKIDYCFIFENPHNSFEQEKQILHNKQIQFYTDLQVMKTLIKGLKTNTHTLIKYNDIF
ncbi:carbamoyl-phosphate synthase large subunit [Candidatus Vidania fulgoroideae]|uniref:Carbamoyl-phosphate synthase large subunit n=1 Tax=Candidatus Vidania fulgoroideorum TaxID=881286 RepID=A0A975AEL0_9PROT|nr:carbamoyl-phosphate synthase large subunit [Candidatus Vidania fulgoroideae]